MQHKHSGLGIASFITSIVIYILIVPLLLLAATIGDSTNVAEETIEIVLGLCMIAMFLAVLVALGLGIAGLAQKGRNRLFAILGTATAAVAILTFVLILIVGSMAE